MSRSQSNGKALKDFKLRMLCSHFDKIVVAFEWKMHYGGQSGSGGSSLGFLLSISNAVLKV